MDKRAMAKANTAKYAQAPSWQEIESFLIELQMNMYHWERFYGLPFNFLTQIKSGVKRLPTYAWHYVYERIKPTYGAGFIDDYSIKEQKPSKKHRLTYNLTSATQIRHENHDRLVTVK